METFFSYVRGDASLAARDATNQFVVPLGVVEAEFPAVSEVSRGSVICWQPDGTQLGGLTNNSGKAVHAGGTARSLVLTVRLSSASEIMPYLPFELLVAGKKVASPSVYYKGGRDYVWFSAGQDARLLDVRLGKPVGEWQDTYAGWEWNGKLLRRPERVISHAGQEAVVTLGQVGDSTGMGASAMWSSRSIPAEWVGRLVAVDDAGVVHLPTVDTTQLRDPAPLGAWRGDDVTFKGLSASRIKELRFQIRRCQWVEVRNISLEPGRRSQVTVVDAAGAPPDANMASKTATRQDGQQSIAISIAHDGTLFLAGKECPPSQLSARLTELAVNKATVVMVQADASTSHKRLVEVMDTCKAAGVHKFSLRTTSRGQK